MRAFSRGYWLGLFIFALLMLPTLASLLHRVGHGEGDFSEFREDGRIALDTGRLGAHLPLPYPPTARPLFVLMALPPARVAAAAWWMLSVGMYWQSAVWIARRALRPAPQREGPAALAVMPFTLVGIVADLTVGQLTALVLFCVTAAFELAERRRGIAAGLVLAIPLLVKPLPVVLLPWFALRRQWRTLLGAAVGWIVLGPLLLSALFGWENQRHGWQHFGGETAGPRSPWKFFNAWADRPGGVETYRRSGLASTLVRLFRPVAYDGNGNSVQVSTLPAAGLMAIWLAVVGAAAAWAGWTAYCSRPDDDERSLRAYAGFIGVMLLANPHFISYWLAFPMLPAALLLVRCIERRTSRDRFQSAAALGIWLLSLVCFAFPVCRAAGSVVVGVLALTIGAIAGARRAPPRTSR